MTLTLRRRRTRVASAAAVSVLVAVLAPFLPGSGVAVAAAAPVTITGTASGDHAWDPTRQQPIAAPPAVTVDQVDNLTNQVVHVTWKNFTPSSNRSGSFFNA